MAEMLISTPPETRRVEDYDVIFQSGMMMPITIDLAKGDTIAFTEKQILVHLSPKASQNDPTKILPAEDTTIFLNHVISVQHRTREIVELNPEEQLIWKQTWDKMSGGTIQ